MSRAARFTWRDEDVTFHNPDVQLAGVQGYVREIAGREEHVRPYERLTGEAVHEHIGAPQFPDGEAEGMFDAYKQHEYIPLNRYLRAGYEGYKQSIGPWPASSEKSIQGEVAALDRVFSAARPTEKPMVVYRGMRGFLPARVTPGTVLKDKAYMSTTTSKQVARDFAETGADHAPRIVEITVPAGERAVSFEQYMGNLGHPETDEEHEVLLPRGRQLRVTGLEGNVIKAVLEPSEEEPPASAPPPEPAKPSKADLLAKALAYKKSQTLAATAGYTPDRSRRFTWEPGDLEITRPPVDLG